MALLVFTAPLWIGGGGAVDLFPKNSLQVGNYFGLAAVKDAVYRYGQLPLWTPAYEGGIFAFAFPPCAALNPVSAVLSGIFRDDVLVDNLTWVVFYMLGACSMYYLCRRVFLYPVIGALFAAVVFSMNGFFPYLQENGLTQGRSIMLLPLLIAFFLKARKDSAYAVYAGMVLAFITFETALFVPVIVLFMAVLAYFKNAEDDLKPGKVWGQPLMRWFIVVVLAFLFSCIKSIPLLMSVGTAMHPLGVPYEASVVAPNTLEMLSRRLLMPVNSWPSLYVGIVPVACTCLGCVLLFRSMTVFIVGFVLAVWLSFGPNAWVDLHKALWHLPVFHDIKEVAKYYGLFIVFFISVLSGGFIAYLWERALKGCWWRWGASLLVIFVAADLVWGNVGYFNSFNAKYQHEAVSVEGDFFNVAMFNGHPGDESITTPLAYFLYKKNIGFINRYDEIKTLTPVTPKYFLLPRYAFLAPSTALLVLPNPSYQGEAYLLGQGGHCRFLKFSPGQLVLDVKTLSADRLVLNQNYSGGWHADRGIVEPYQGLLSIRFDGPFADRVRLSFLPFSFILGMSVSVAAFIGSMLYLFARARSRKDRGV
jgi:hypothetical protein